MSKDGRKMSPVHITLKVGVKMELEKHCYPFQNVLLFPLPCPMQVETQEKLQVHVSNIVGEVGEGAEQVYFNSSAIWGQ